MQRTLCNSKPSIMACITGFYQFFIAMPVFACLDQAFAETIDAIKTHRAPRALRALTRALRPQPI